MHRIWIFLLAFTLTACSTVTPPGTVTTTSPTTSTPPASWQQRQAALSQLQNWQIRGKIAAQTSKGSGSATLDWVQHQSHYTIALTGPMGTNSIKLAGEPGQVLMQTADGKQTTAPTAEELLAKQWGWHLPVSNLKYWIRGIPAPGGNSQTQFDSHQRLVHLTQQGWNVQYLSYMNSHGLDLPERIAITSPDLKVKMLVYKWDL